MRARKVVVSTYIPIFFSIFNAQLGKQFSGAQGA